MKIVHIAWSLLMGGIETMLVNIANEQVKMGADVTIMLVNDLYEPTLVKQIDEQVKFMTLGRKLGSYSPMYVYRLNRELSRLKPDVIHLHSSEFYDAIFKRKFREITHSTCHDLPVGTVYRYGKFSWVVNFVNFLSRRCREGNVLCIDRIPRVFAISDSVKKDLKEKYNVDSLTIYNGILSDKIQERSNERLISQVLRVVMVSRLVHEKKGQDLLIRAASKLKGKIDVTFIGEGVSLIYLKQLARELQIEKYVHFLGKQSQEEVAEHLCDYDLFCQPSRIEGFGLTVAEGMAAGLPMVVSSGQGPSEVTKGDKYGYTFENGSVDDLVRVLQTIIADYPTALEKASLGRQHVIGHYDVKTTAKRYLQAYNR